MILIYLRQCVAQSRARQWGLTESAWWGAVATLGEIPLVVRRPRNL